MDEERETPLLNDPEQEKKVRRCAAAKRAVQIVMGLLVVAGAVLGKVFGSWWWALGAFGIGVVVTFVALYVTELAVWYISVRPYESAADGETAEAEDKKEDRED